MVKRKAYILTMLLVMIFTNVHSQKIFTGTQSLVINGNNYENVRYKREFKIENNTFITEYSLFNKRGKLFLIISCNYNENIKEIDITMKNPSSSEFSRVFEPDTKYNITYEDCDGLILGQKGYIFNLAGDDRWELYLAFKDLKKKHLIIYQIKDNYSDLNKQIHYELDKIPKNIFPLHDQMLEKCKKIEAENERKRQEELEEKRKLAEAKRKEEEIRRKKEEAERLRKFLAERKTTTYQYKEVDNTQYTNIKNAMDKQLLSVYNSKQDDNYDVEFTVTLKIDTSNNATQNIEFQKQAGEIGSKIEKSVASVELKPVYKNGYTVNASMNEKYQMSRTSQKLTIKTSQSSIKLIEGDENLFNSNSSFLENQLKATDKPYGKYSIVFSESEFNGKSYKSVKYIDYKGLGGPSSAFLSVLIPGLGNHSVNGGKGSMLGKNASPWITTVGTFALIGSGVGLRMAYQKNYELYHQATTQTEIDKYYDLANSQYQTSAALFGIGAGIWIADIIWTASKGAKNKKQEKQVKDNLNIAFHPTATPDNILLTMTLKIK